MWRRWYRPLFSYFFVDDPLQCLYWHNPIHMSSIRFVCNFKMNISSRHNGITDVSRPQCENRLSLSLFPFLLFLLHLFRFQIVHANWKENANPFCVDAFLMSSFQSLGCYQKLANEWSKWKWIRFVADGFSVSAVFHVISCGYYIKH